jgi:hypothetical protein
MRGLSMRCKVETIRTWTELVAVRIQVSQPVVISGHFPETSGAHRAGTCCALSSSGSSAHSSLDVAVGPPSNRTAIRVST